MVSLNINSPDLDKHTAPLGDDFPAEAEAVFDTKQLVPKTNPRRDTPPMHFKGFFKANLSYGKGGMAEITLQIPYEYRQYALTMYECAFDVPMEIYIRPCRNRTNHGV